MTDLCQVLPWDSEFFGFRIARVNRDRLSAEELNEVLRWCDQEKVRCLYFLCAGDQVETANRVESQQFHLADMRVDFDWVPTEKPAQPTIRAAGSEIRPATPDDLPELLPIVDHRFTDSRFFMDQGFPAEKSNLMFLRWVENDVRGKGRAEHVWVAVQEGAIVGFATIDRSNDETRRLGLIAVSRPATGVGSDLVAQVQDYSRSKGAKRLLVGTQLRNVRAQRLYQRCGFRTCEVGMWYHRWFA